MEELLKTLEQKIKMLIKQHNGLSSSNQQLHQSKYLLACEKDMLLVRQHKAAKQIEDLISKLKAIEE